MYFFQKRLTEIIQEIIEGVRYSEEFFIGWLKVFPNEYFLSDTFMS
jgi:hypothetical protein